MELWIYVSTTANYFVVWYDYDIISIGFILPTYREYSTTTNQY